MKTDFLSTFFFRTVTVKTNITLLNLCVIGLVARNTESFENGFRANQTPNRDHNTTQYHRHRHNVLWTFCYELFVLRQISFMIIHRAVYVEKTRLLPTRSRGST